VDTDGIFFVPPIGVDTKRAGVCVRIGSEFQTAGGITVAMDGRNRKILSYKKKNYALLGYDNKVRIKGSSLVSRSMEQFGRSTSAIASTSTFTGTLTDCTACTCSITMPF